jgi:hypothetical protein
MIGHRRELPPAAGVLTPGGAAVKQALQSLFSLLRRSLSLRRQVRMSSGQPLPAALQFAV